MTTLTFIIFIVTAPLWVAALLFMAYIWRWGLLYCALAIGLVFAFQAKAAHAESASLERQMDAYPQPAYGTRAWSCANHAGLRTCQPFTVLKYGEERVKAYQGWGKIKNHLKIDGKTVFSD